MISKSCIVYACLLVAVLAVEKYSSKYDNIDLEEVKNNPKLLQAYANCLLDKGKCTAEGKELKEHFQEALENGCERCTDKQKEGIEIMAQHIIDKHPEVWKEVSAKFDPKGIYRKKYEDLAREKGIVLP